MKSSFQNALLLEYVTLAWNVVGSIIVITASVKSSSVSLLGFGIDSMIEIFASLIVIWQLKTIHKNKEAVAMKLLGIAFLLLGVYLIIQGSAAIIQHTKSYPSDLGVWWLAVTTVVMFLLAYGKKQIGKAIQNPIVIKEASITVVDGLLALAVLVGLLFTKYFEWSWADLAACFILALYAFKEGIKSFKF